MSVENSATNDVIVPIDDDILISPCTSVPNEGVEICKTKNFEKYKNELGLNQQANQRVKGTFITF